MHFEADYENMSAVRGGMGYEISKGDFEDTLLDDTKNAVKSCPSSAIKIIEPS